MNTATSYPQVAPRPIPSENAGVVGKYGDPVLEHVVIAALQQCRNSMFLTDANGVIVWANRAFEELTGYAVDEAVGRNPRFLKSGRQGRRYYQQMWDTIRAGHVWSHETIDRDRYGSLYTIHQTISPVRQNGRISHYLSVHEDVSRKRALRQEEERAIRTDHLTGLLNTTAFMDALSSRLRTASAEDGMLAILSIAMVESQMGPDSTALMLGEIGQRIRAAMIGTDEAGYLGGMQFGLILESVGSREEAEAFGEAIVQEIHQPFPFLGECPQLAPRVGIALYPEDGTEAGSLWQRADDAVVMRPR